MSERRGSKIYDPARDIFTKSDEVDDEALEDSPAAGEKRKHSEVLESPKSPEATAAPQTAPAEPEASKENDTPAKPDDEPSAKKQKLSPIPPPKDNKPIPLTAASLSQIPKGVKKAPPKPDDKNKKPDLRRDDALTSRRRSRSPSRDSPESRRRERRRTPPRRSASPKPISRSPTPPPRSPPRERKRPGAGARISAADKEAIRRRQEEREREQQGAAQAEAAARGVHDVVRQHYNAVPQRGREWRKTDSRIKGLRSLNNWIKSAIIQKFSPNENYTPGAQERGSDGRHGDNQGLLILDVGCGKGGDLQKWNAAPQGVDLYVGLDPADISIDQAKERYSQMQKGRGNFQNRRRRLFDARFAVKDCFGEWLGDLPIIQEVGLDTSVGLEGATGPSRWGGGGFDVVSMMFCMHYSFESENKAKMMLRNVSGVLKKGGRFLGVIPNSDLLSAKVKEHNAKKGVTVVDDDDDDWDPEKPADSQKEESKPSDATNGDSGKGETLEWGNGLYSVKFPGKIPDDGVFRPPFGWKYFFYLEEAVEEIPEYVVPWEKLRSMAEDYNLELQYRKSFREVWDAEKDDPILGPLTERMNVRDRDTGRLLVTEEEFEAADFYLAFCFYKV